MAESSGSGANSNSLAHRVKSMLEMIYKRGGERPTEDEMVRSLKQLHKEYRGSAKNPAFRRAVARAMNEVPEPVAQPEESNKRLKHNALSASLSSSYRNNNKNPGGTEHAEEKKADGAQHDGDSKLVNRPSVRYADVGGVEHHLQELRELCEYPLRHPEIYDHLGVRPPRGILLHGPPGTGKTLLAHAIAGELGVAFFRLAAPEIVSGMSGESEEKVRNLFTEASRCAPSIIFIDEIDAITSKRESNARGMELRIVAQLLTCMDGVGEGSDGVLVIGATNRPDALDPALRRAGRFDREICLGIPDAQARERVLGVLVAKMRISGDVDFKSIAKRTPGFVGADLAALTKEAAVIAVNRIFQYLEDPENKPSDDIQSNELDDDPDVELEKRNLVSQRLRAIATPLTQEQLAPLSVEMSDFEAALPKVQPSSLREGFATVPSVTWEEVGALANAREELTLAISEPIRRPERFRSMGLTVPAGVLLFGPPGCGKSLLAKAIAGSSGANFISIKGPELLNKYVGESERAVRQVFSRARSSAPCIVFFDELDALCPRRDSAGGGSSEGNGVSERVVNQLLTEMDGLDARKSVFVIAATNRPELIDPAMLRPGRLDRLVYVPVPNTSDRIAILKACTRRTPLAPEVDLKSIAKDTRLKGFSGADLAALVREAAVNALWTSGALQGEDQEQEEEEAPKVTMSNFEHAIGRVAPSISEHDQVVYQRSSEQLASVRNRQIERRKKRS